MKIDINKKYRYRNGKPARILCVDGPCIYLGEPQPVMSMDADGEVNAHFPSGRFVSAVHDSDLDLIEVREPREWTVAVRPGTCKVCEIYEDKGPLDLHGWERVRVREIID